MASILGLLFLLAFSKTALSCVCNARFKGLTCQENSTWPADDWPFQFQSMSCEECKCVFWKTGQFRQQATQQTLMLPSSPNSQCASYDVDGDFVHGVWKPHADECALQ